MLTVKKAGLFSTVQDDGRKGYMQFGIIKSGVMDHVAFRLGNALLHQSNAAAIEMTMVGDTFQFSKPTLIALTGGTLIARLNGSAVAMNRAIAVKAGDVLSCGPIQNGARSYLCIKGGFQVPVVLGSRSTDYKAGFGGHLGRALQKGDELAYEAYEGVVPKCFLQTERFYEQGPIRLLQGGEWEKLGHEVQQSFLHNQYELSLHSNRMGNRLIPDNPIKVPPFNLLSEAVTFGTVQLPPNGEPIVLMADHQTSGGYPKVAQVIAADLHRMAQLSPKSTIKFEVVSIAMAESLYEKLELTIRTIEFALQQRWIANG